MDQQAGAVTREYDEISGGIPAVAESPLTRTESPADNRQGILGLAIVSLKKLYLRFGIWLPVGAAGVFALVLTILYTSLATAERAGDSGSVPAGQAVPGGVEIQDSAGGLRGSLKGALRRGLQVQPSAEGGN